MSSSLLRSLLSNWIGLSLSIIIGFIISPFVVHHLGRELYGSWALIISITSQFVIFDLGARYAVMTFVARYRQERDNEKLSDFLSSGLMFFGLCALAAFAVLICLLPLFGTVFEIPPQQLHVVRVAFILAAIDAAADVACGFYDSVLTGSERYDTFNALNVLRLLANALLLVLVLKLELGIVGISAAALTSRTIQRALSARFAWAYNPQAKVQFDRIRRPILRQIASYGLWSSVIQAAYRLIHKADSVIAGIFVGMSGVTTYAIPVILIDQYRSFAETGNYILTPRFSALSASGDKATIDLLLLKWSRYCMFLALGLGTPLIISGPDFILLWMGESFTDCGKILQLLAAPFFLILPGMPFMHYLYAVQKHALNAKVLAAEAAINIALSLVLVRQYGLTGIAFATLLPAIILRGVALPWGACELSGLRFSSYVRHSILACLPLAVFQFTSLLWLNSVIGAKSWPSFFVNNSAGACLFIIVVYFFYLGREERAYIARRLGISSNNHP
ncbi:MAG: hypothetical protein K1X79_10485 [Oligoflexia bacterium]|nr:hypothetical protein [Oligoflexia bacterium]